MFGVIRVILQCRDARRLAMLTTWLVSSQMLATAKGQPASVEAPATVRLPALDEVIPVTHAAPLDSLDDATLDPPAALASYLQPSSLSMGAVPSGARNIEDNTDRLGVGVDLYSAPDFSGGLIIHGPDVSMKIGGYVKADFIYDFNPIDSTDSFVTTTIPVGAPHRTNSRFHARQSRLSFDTRWHAASRSVRIFVEGDFFSESDQFRLRHAFGEVGPLLVGRTWTTFTDIAAAPDTLDFEGSVSSVNRRQAQARWTTPFVREDLTLAIAVEDTQFIIVPPMGVTGEPRSPSPDFVARLRWTKDWGQFQIANLHRVGGFQPTGGNVFTAHAWGLNCTGAFLLTPATRAYSQVVFGDGIGSYRGLPDAAPTTGGEGDLVGIFGWMTGVTHDWTDGLSSNVTYAENQLDNTPGQLPTDVHRTTYLAANLIWKPLERARVGVEYLHGIRENIDGAASGAHRIQVAFIFDLP